MPGIAGIVDPEGKVDQNALLERVLGTMLHEPFYQTDLFPDSAVALGRIHLGAANPQPQPIFNEKKDLCIIMQGELYGCEPLITKLQRKHKFAFENDPEVALHLYEEEGLGFLNSLNGSFALAIRDIKNRRLIIANDRYGSIPVYYAGFDGMFAFAPETKGFTAIDSFPRILNEEALADFFTFGYLLGDKTFLKGVNLLPAASTCTVNEKTATFELSRYWDFQFPEDKDATLENITRTLNSLLVKSVNERAHGEKKLGIGLTGGIDSRTVVACMNPELRSQLFAFTFGMENNFDHRVSAKLAEALKIEHEFYPIDDYTPAQLQNAIEQAVYMSDGMYLGSLGISLISNELRKHVDSVILGFSGELWRGANISQTVVDASSQEELERILFSKMCNNVLPYGEQKNLFSDGYKKLEELPFKNVKAELEKETEITMPNKAEYFMARNLLRRYNNLGFYQFGCFVQCRTPFYDYSLTDFIQTLPPRTRLESQYLSELYTTYYPELLRIPLHCSWTNYSGALKSTFKDVRRGAWQRETRMLQRISRGKFLRKNPYQMVDFNYLFRTKLKDFVESVLLDSRTLERPYFNPEYINKLIGVHMTGKRNCAATLSALIRFELWNRKFLD